MHTQMAFKCETTNLVLFGDHTCDVKSTHKWYHIQPVCTVYTGTAVCVSLCVCGNYLTKFLKLLLPPLSNLVSLTTTKKYLPCSERNRF